MVAKNKQNKRVSGKANREPKRRANRNQSSKIKTAKIAKSTPKISRAEMDARLHNLRYACVGSLIVASFALLIDLSLVITGGWDDLIILLLALAPFFALLATIIAYYTMRKYRRHRVEFFACLSLFCFFSVAFFGMTGFLFGKKLIQNRKVEHEPAIVGIYNCAKSELSREYQVYDVRFALATKAYEIEDVQSGTKAVGSYEAEYWDGKYHLNTLIKENDVKDDSFSETNYILEFEEGNSAKLSSETFGIVRYCTKE